MCKTLGLNIGAMGLTVGERNDISEMRNGIVMDTFSVASIFETDFSDLEGEIHGILPQPGEPVEDIKRVNQVGVYSRKSNVEVDESDMSVLQMGVYAYNSLTSVSNNTIDVGASGRACVELIDSRRASILGNTLTDGRFGVYLQSNGGEGLNRVNNNTIDRQGFQGGSAGIAVEAALSAGEIERNVIDLTINSAASGFFNSGIWLLNARKYDVDDNDVTFSATGFSSAQFHLGIYALSSMDNTIQKNDILGSSTTDGSIGVLNLNAVGNTWFCNDVEQLQYGMRFAGSGGQSDLTANIIDTCGFGLHLDAPTFIGRQTLNGNAWTSMYASWGAFINANSTDDAQNTAEDSEFVVPTGGGTGGVQLPPTIGPSAVSGNWFFEVPGNAKTCLITPDDPIQADTLVDLVRNIPQFKDYDDQMEWMVKADVFQLLLNDTTLLSNTVLDSFFDAEATTPIGILVSAMDTLLQKHGLDETNLVTTEAAIDRLVNDIADIDSILYTNPSDSVSQRSLRALKVDTLATEVGDWGDLISEGDSVSMERWEANLDVLDTLTTRSNIEGYYRDALQIYGKWRIGDTLTTTDSTDLRTLAGQCIWQGGHAIGLAMSMIHVMGDTITPAYFTCASSSPMVQQVEQTVSQSSATTYTIFPNPASDYIDINAEGAITEVQVTDLMGRVIRVLRPNARTVRIDLRDVGAGTYLVQAYRQGVDTPDVQKIIIAR